MAWGIVFAHPGCEQTAPLSRERWADHEEALAALQAEAESWDDGYHLVVPFGDGYLVSAKHDPMRVTRLLVRFDEDP